MFDLKRPCKNCPFRKGQGELFGMARERLDEIKNGVAFQCHRTVDYGHFDNPRKRQGKHPQQCAGLMAVLAREGATNTIMQIAERMAGMDFFGLDPRHEAYDNWADVLKAHGENTGARTMRASVKVLPVPESFPGAYHWEVIHHGRLVGSYPTRKAAREAARLIRAQEREKVFSDESKPATASTS